MTLNQIIEELRIANPEPYGQTNGEKYKMEGAELEAYYTEAAKSILEENEKVAAKTAQESKKQEVLAKLGLTADEVTALLA